MVGEGPLGRRGSWLLSARKSYLDLLIKQVSDDDNFAFGFSDLAGKLAWDLTANQKLDVSAVVGRSKLSASQRHVGVNNPLVAWNDAFLGVVGWHYAPAPRLLVSQRVSISGGRYYGAGWLVSLACAIGIMYFIRRRRGGGLTDPGRVDRRGPGY